MHKIEKILSISKKKNILTIQEINIVAKALFQKDILDVSQIILKTYEKNPQVIDGYFYSQKTRTWEYGINGLELRLKENDNPFLEKNQ